jgi:GNAT superfamily N-acetyltransferase
MSRPAVEQDDLTLRFATREDLAAIGDFLPELAGPHYAEQFPGRTAREFLDWKYFRNPAGEAIVGVAAAPGRVVGTVAAVPVRLQLGDEVVTAYNLGDFLTAAEFRNRGLFSRLVDLVCREAEARGAALAYVQPNANSYPILIRRSFREPFRFELRYFPVPSRALARKLGIPAAVTARLRLDAAALRLALPRRDRSVVVEPATAFDARIDRLWEDARRGYRVLVARDRGRLQWRFAECPTPYRILVARRGEEVAGYIVTFANRATGEAHVADLFSRADDRAAAAELLRRSFEELVRGPMRAIFAWTIAAPGPCMIGDLLRGACRLTWSPLHFALRPLGPRTNADLPAGGWYLTDGDFDTI